MELFNKLRTGYFHLLRGNYRIEKRDKIILIALFIALVLISIFAKGFYSLIPLVIFISTIIIEAAMAVTLGKKLNFSITADGNGEKGQPFVFNIAVKNESVLPAGVLSIEIYIENLINGENLIVEQKIIVPPKKTKIVSCPIKSIYAGCFKAEVRKCRVSGLLDMIRRNSSLNFEGSLNYNVLPHITEMKLSQDTIAGYDMESFKYSQNKKGNDPGEIFGIREYVNGDSVKSIHWKLSGKMDKLVIREMGLPIENNILILLDKKIKSSEQAGNSVNHAANIDRLTDLFFSLSLAIAKQGIKHDIGWYDCKNKSFVIKNVDNSEAVWDAGIETLRTPHCSNMLSTVFEFLQSGCEKNYSNYLIVGDSFEDTERLMEYGTVTEFAS
ncbi:Protein of unknown function DUF58 [Peptostreptococcaceae bacterium pGA-8]|nr:Protein of unknown function DUF58 [Peptostreptococcaceae bacterium pGA-8]